MKWMKLEKKSYLLGLLIGMVMGVLPVGFFVWMIASNFHDVRQMSAAEEAQVRLSISVLEHLETNDVAFLQRYLPKYLAVTYLAHATDFDSTWTLRHFYKSSDITQCVAEASMRIPRLALQIEKYRNERQTNKVSHYATSDSAAESSAHED
mgnify:FL=1